MELSISVSENDQENQLETSWFDRLIEDYDYQKPKPGLVLEGKIIRKDGEGIFADVGLKRDAFVPVKDLEEIDSEWLAQLSENDTVPLCVIELGTDDQVIWVSLSKGLAYQDWKKAEEHLREGTILNLEIVGQNRGGLLVRFEKLVGFLPYSQVPELRSTRNYKALEKIKKNSVGNRMDLKIIEVTIDRNRLIFSASAAKSEKREQRLAELKEGDIVNGKVVKLTDFGGFVDLGGIDGLVHISQMDYKKIDHPSDVIQSGDEIQVKIISIDRERQRIGLSRKALIPSPWETISKEYQAGDFIIGTIKRITNFGAFTRLPNGVDGLVHISQLGYSANSNPIDSVKPGDRVLVKVLDVDPLNRRIALSMRQVPLERQIAWVTENIPKETTDSTSLHSFVVEKADTPNQVDFTAPRQASPPE